MHNWYNDNLFNTPLARISQKISPGEKSRKVVYLATEGLFTETSGVANKSYWLVPC